MFCTIESVHACAIDLVKYRQSFPIIIRQLSVKLFVSWARVLTLLRANVVDVLKWRLSPVLLINICSMLHITPVTYLGIIPENGFLILICLDFQIKIFVFLNLYIVFISSCTKHNVLIFLLVRTVRIKFA